MIINIINVSTFKYKFGEIFDKRGKECSKIMGIGSCKPCKEVVNDVCERDSWCSC